MKRIEWIIAGFSILIGLLCLTMSATTVLNPSSFQQYWNMFIQICMMVGIPLVIAGVLYLIFRKKGEPK